MNSLHPVYHTRQLNMDYVDLEVELIDKLKSIN